MLLHLLIYFFAFAGIWIGSGLAIGSVERLSKILRVSSFLVSFIVLGFFTSIGELSVGINSILVDDPEIFVGNLIGASIVLLMLIVPLLAITGKSIKISPEFQGFNLPAALVVISLPVFLSLDGLVSHTDGLIAISLFFLLIVAIQNKKSLFEQIKKIDYRSKSEIGRELLRLLFGIVLIFIASKFVVEQTIYFSQLLHVSPFIISLLVISLGTNVPELSFIIRSVFMKSNQIAFGDYVGSAVFNTFLLGFLTLIYSRPVYLTNSYLISLFFLVVGLLAFFYFARTKNSISRAEGLVLLLLYFLFVFVEIYLHKGTFSVN